MSEEKQGYLYLFLFTIFNGCVSVLARVTQNLGAQELVFLRGVITVACILLVVVATGKLKELAPRNILPTALVGLFEGLSVYLYFLSIERTTIANALFLVYSAPFFSVLLARVFLKETIERTTLIGLVVTMTGIFLIADPRGFSFHSTQNVGNVLALLSGILYAAMATIAKPVLKTMSGYYVVFWQYVVISLMFVFFVPVTIGEKFLMNWWQLLLLGGIGTGVAIVLFMEGVKRVKAQKVFIVASLEPVMGTLMAFAFLREVPSVLTVLGAGIIFAGVYQITRSANS